MNDIVVAALLVALAAAWTAVGWQLCTSRHRQRGIEVDRYWDVPSDLWPGGSPVTVDWDRELRNLREKERTS